MLTGPERIGRRAFLGATAALPLAAAMPLAADERSAEATGGGLIVRQKSPDNLETPFAALDRFITPTERFFVRSHFAVPSLDAKTWKLKVEGAVKQPLELPLDELLKMPSKALTATLE